MSDSRSEVLLDGLRPLIAELVEPLAERVAELERQLDEVRAREWYTLDEAGDRLGCTRDAVRMRANRGRLEARRQGRRVYVSARSVDGLR